ncbi:unnamed protein product [Arabis nemorensis]|uniref:Uncharacterized protein n=1 Tax=Arabis nemorensis TaxID=586526 RepID=A0A565B011_9BRAS|nr:unnamed protein product [Arabis nemorensis]
MKKSIAILSSAKRFFFSIRKGILNLILSRSRNHARESPSVVAEHKQSYVHVNFGFSEQETHRFDDLTIAVIVHRTAGAKFGDVVGFTEILGSSLSRSDLCNVWLHIVLDVDVGQSCLVLRFSDDSFTTSFITTIGEVVDACNQHLKRVMDLLVKHEYLLKHLQIHSSYSASGIYLFRS